MCLQKTGRACGTSGSRALHDGAVRDERTARLQADELGTIDASLPAAESGTRLGTAAALEGAGDQAHALRLSPADRNLGERRASGKSQTSVSAVSGRRLGHAHPTTASDSLEWNEGQAGSEQAE